MPAWKKMLRRKLLVVAAVGSVLGLLYWAYSSSDLGAGGGVPAEVSEARWPVGEQRTYAVRLDSRVRFEGQDIMVVSVAGELGMTRVGAENLELAAAVEVSSASLALQASPEEEAAVRRALGEPFSIRFGPGGRVEEIGFPPVDQPEAARALARGLLRTLAAALQVASPPSGDQQEWIAEERDPVGVVRVRYQRRDHDLAKRKLEYVRVTSKGPLVDARTEFASSLADLTFDGRGTSPETLVGVQQREETTVRSEGPLPTLGSTLDLSLRIVSRKAATPEELAAHAAALPQYQRSALDDRSVEGRIAIDHGKLQEGSFLGVLGALTKLGKDDLGERARLFSLLKTNLRFNEEDVEEAERMIREGSPDTATLIDALGSAGSARAQEVLQSVVREDTFGDDERRRALISLSMAEQPSAETIALLQGLTEDPVYGKQALYGLGSAAYNLNSSRPETARELTAAMTRRLEGTADPNQRVVLLKAVGNAGHVDSLEVLGRQLKDPDPAVRGTAVWALRRIPGEQADQAIALALRSDPAPSVKLKALDAFEYRSPVPVLVYTLRDSLQGEEHVGVRRGVVRAAMRWAHAAPVLKPLLERLATTDPDEKIRRLLEGLK